MVKQPSQAEIASIQANMKALSEPPAPISEQSAPTPIPTRPLVEKLEAQLAFDEAEWQAKSRALEALAKKIWETRKELMWLRLNPEFDALHRRLIELDMNGKKMSENLEAMKERLDRIG